MLRVAAMKNHTINPVRDPQDDRDPGDREVDAEQVEGRQRFGEELENAWCAEAGVVRRAL
jgi:hypothetical protein